jgi:hypothetical protein
MNRLLSFSQRRCHAFDAGHLPIRPTLVMSICADYPSQSLFCPCLGQATAQESDEVMG